MRGYTHTFNFMPLKGWESDADSFRLHALEPLEVDMVDCFVPYLYVRDGFMAFRKHNRFHLVRVEDEHLALSSSASNEAAFLLNEVASVVEADLHTLFQYFTNWDQVLCYGKNKQDVFNVRLVSLFADRHITDISYWMRGVISSLNIVGSFRLSHISEPF